MPSQSGPLHVVVRFDWADDEWYLDKVNGNKVSPNPEKFTLSDVDWFNDDVQNVGICDTLNLSDLVPEVDSGDVFIDITGHMWSHHYETCDGGDWEGGFEVEEFKPSHKLISRKERDAKEGTT